MAVAKRGHAETKQRKLLFQPERRAGSSWKPNGNCLKRNGKTTATMNRNNNEKQQRVLRFRDIPFPSSGADFLTFLISSQGPFSEMTKMGGKERNENSQRDGIRISLRKIFRGNSKRKTEKTSWRW